MKTISLPDKVFSRLKAYSKAKDIRMEDFVESSIDDRLTQLEQWEHIRARLPKATREDFLRILHAPERDRPPIKGDELRTKVKAARRAAPVKRTRRVAA